MLSRHQGFSPDIPPVERKVQLPIPHGKHLQALESDDDDVPDSELREDDWFALIRFVMLLALPTPDVPTFTTVAGRDAFLETGCGEGGALPVTVRPDGVSPYGVRTINRNISQWVDSVTSHMQKTRETSLCRTLWV